MTKKQDMIRAVKRSKVYKEETNSTVTKKLLAKAGQHDCQICAPWDGENRVTRKAKHGAKKPKGKIKRVVK